MHEKQKKTSKKNERKRTRHRVLTRKYIKFIDTAYKRYFQKVHLLDTSTGFSHLTFIKNKHLLCGVTMNHP